MTDVILSGEEFRAMHSEINLLTNFLKIADEAINNAPHDSYARCGGIWFDESKKQEVECECWKAKALESIHKAKDGI